MKCQRCQSALVPGDKFCPICGTKVEAVVDDKPEEKVVVDNIKQEEPSQTVESVQEETVEHIQVEEIQEESVEQSQQETIQDNDKEPMSTIEKNSQEFIQTPPTVKSDFETLVLIGAIVAAVGCFLPFAGYDMSILGTSYSQSVSYFDRDGFFVLIALIATLILSKSNNEKIAFIPLGIGGCITIYDMMNVGSGFASYLSYASSGGYTVSLKIGAFIIVAGIAICALGLYQQMQKHQ